MVITQSLKVAQELRCTSNIALIYMKEKITKVQAKVLAEGPSIGLTTGLSSQH